MSTPAHPFLDQTTIRTVLYATADRLAQRTSALHAARVSGEPATKVIASFIRQQRPAHDALVTDIGCGRGSTTLALAEALPKARVIALDASTPLLHQAKNRLAAAGAHRAVAVTGDFHRLPLPDECLDLVVAAFCLYHSPVPHQVIAEIRRCLLPGGTLIIATKSRDSYASLDRLMVASGLDPLAEQRPSLYEALHSDNLTKATADVMEVRQVRHDEHRFRFADLTHAAAYLATSPKYDLPHHLRKPTTLTVQLRRHLPDGPVETNSTVSYLVASRDG